jgi:hypothetical protein
LHTVKVLKHRSIKKEDLHNIDTTV